ncbi:hypothetical protein RABR111495_11620 [Rahnella bruchi]|jgi:hypothetical protein|nr:hypothetical protein [Rahnella bruchi]
MTKEEVEKHRVVAEAVLEKCYQSYQDARLALHLAIEKEIEDPDENTEYDSLHEQMMGELWEAERSAKAIYEAQRTVVERLRTRLEQWQPL